MEGTSIATVSTSDPVLIKFGLGSGTSPVTLSQGLRTFPVIVLSTFSCTGSTSATSASGTPFEVGLTSASAGQPRLRLKSLQEAVEC